MIEPAPAWFVVVVSLSLLGVSIGMGFTARRALRLRKRRAAVSSAIASVVGLIWSAVVLINTLVLILAGRA